MLNTDWVAVTGTTVENKLGKGEWEEMQNKINVTALAGVAPLERWPPHYRVAGSIPGQGTYLGCGVLPWSGCMRGRVTI